MGYAEGTSVSVEKSKAEIALAAAGQGRSSKDLVVRSYTLTSHLRPGGKD